ncbi:hypothetical protein D3C87_1540650 [compost metagenome]
MSSRCQAGKGRASSWAVSCRSQPLGAKGTLGVQTWTLCFSARKSVTRASGSPNMTPSRPQSSSQRAWVVWMTLPKTNTLARGRTALTIFAIARSSLRVGKLSRMPTASGTSFSRERSRSVRLRRSAQASVSRTSCPSRSATAAVYIRSRGGVKAR